MPPSGFIRIKLVEYQPPESEKLEKEFRANSYVDIRVKEVKSSGKSNGFERFSQNACLQFTVTEVLSFSGIVDSYFSC